MGLFDFMLDKLAAKLQKRVYGTEVHGSYSDAFKKGVDFSVESQISESLANLTTLNFEMPVSGDNDRARLLDVVSDDFCNERFPQAISTAFLTGDCVVVPSWNGRTMDNVVVPSGSFAILGATGDRITSLLYIVDEKKDKNSSVTWTLCRLVELQGRTVEGQHILDAHYKTAVFKNGSLYGFDLKDFPDWAKENTEEWWLPNVDRLPIGRFKSFTQNPNNPNAAKGAPICFGASAPIREIHYLMEQMHKEFDLSSKRVFADKSLFTKEYRRDKDGNIIGEGELKLGKSGLFMALGGRNGATDPLFQEWAPTIQAQPYFDALDRQYQEVERCVGVSSGILSNLNEQSYQNVDNVRKSTIKTQAFINTARKVAQEMLEDLLYSWDAILNYYEVTPTAPYEVQYKWSDDYINTFTDQQNAILAGETIGATDAVDYRMFVLGEAPEVAKAKVAEIAASRPSLVGE